MTTITIEPSWEAPRHEGDRKCSCRVSMAGGEQPFANRSSEHVNDEHTAVDGGTCSRRQRLGWNARVRGEAGRYNASSVRSIMVRGGRIVLGPRLWRSCRTSVARIRSKAAHWTLTTVAEAPRRWALPGRERACTDPSPSRLKPWYRRPTLLGEDKIDGAPTLPCSAGDTRHRPHYGA
jgi:hypothetical protein